MAIQNDDLLIVQRPSTLAHYKMKIADLPSSGSGGGTALPDGTEVGQYLQWDGAQWGPSSEMDGGSY